jgi:hypothetical protein
MPKFRKLEVKDVRDIERLVTDNSEGIEPGLKIIDSSLLLGQARIDLVGVDARDRLVLGAVGFTANDEMLLRALEAYSWCVEFPETLRRLYPKSRFRPGRTPRVVFVAERMSDAFVRKARHLAFPEIDCLTFLYLQSNGTPVVYFDVIERLRRETGGPQAEVPAAVDGVEQSPFIEGTPPETPWDDPDGNGAWQSRLTAAAEAAASAVPAAASSPSWAAVARATDAPLGDMPLDPALLTPQADSRGGRTEAVPVGAAGPRESLEQYKGEWREFLDRLGAAQLSVNGKLSRKPHGFIGGQFEPAE